MKGSICFLLLAILALTCASLSYFDKADRFSFKPQVPKAQCGYESCPSTKEGHLNVHLVPHSHDDVGWLKTVQQYYNGEMNSIQEAEIRKIITGVVEELQKSPDRRFIQVETAFLWRWWEEQDELKRDVMRNLVNSGQLEFVGGGWSVNDEACPHYTAIVDQLSLGLRFLNSTFGSCGRPRTGWQIDPFGHSIEMASIFAEMGYDAQFLGRLDYQDKRNRMDTKTMEFIWNAKDNLGESSSLFTSVLFNMYQPPQGFCFDTVFCSDSFNDDKVDLFITKANEWAAPYNTEHILMTMGSDFHYQDASTWFTNMDKLIKAVNGRQLNGTKINLIYSTPSCYLQQVNQAGLTWPVQSGDFMPYADAQHDFWTGYFTSRPTFKYFIQQGNNFLQICKQLTALTDDGQNGGQNLANIFKLEEALGIMQHHDGITGTAKQHVTNDYASLINIGMLACEQTISEALLKIEGAKNNIVLDMEHTFCHHLNVSECPASESKSEFVVTVYNPLAWTVVDDYVRIPVTTTDLQVEGPTGILETQFIPLPPSVMEIPGRASGAMMDMVFNSGQLNGLSLTNFKITQGQKPALIKLVDVAGHSFEIKNSIGIALDFNEETNLLEQIRFGGNNLTLRQEFLYYKSSQNYDGRPSGAYIFQPDGIDPFSFSKPTINVYDGIHVTEVHQVFSPWVSGVTRIYDKMAAIEFEWLVGPIPVEDGIGKEVIMRFTTDLATNGAFYADANGRQLIRRQRDQRETWDYTPIEPISGNYYPVTSRLAITEGQSLEENKRTLILLNDRSQGGSSIHDGEVELMLHRRCLRDDGLGVGEALNEQAFGTTGLVARGKVWLIFAGEGTGLPTSIHRVKAQEIFMNRILAFRDLVPGEESFTVKADRFSNLTNNLPSNCHLLSLTKISASEYLIRLEHFYDVNESETMSTDFDIQLTDLKLALNADTLEETTLGGDRWKTESSRLTWKTGMPLRSSEWRAESTLNFKPMQIRTFIFTLLP